MTTTTNNAVKANNAKVLNGLRANRKPINKLGATAPVVAPVKRASRPAMTKADFMPAPVVAPVKRVRKPKVIAPAPVAEVIAPVAASTQTPEQVAALNELRAAKAKTKADHAAQVAAAEAAMPPFVASSTHAGIAADALSTRIREAINSMLGYGEDSAMPSWKRKLSAFFGAILLSGAAGYAIGTLAGYAIVGVASLGGSILWAYLIMVIALILAAYAGFKIGEVVGNYVLSGQIDKDLKAAKAKVTGWFTFGKSEPKLIAA